MSRCERQESPTGYYHVMQRGTGKQILFESEEDYSRYLMKLWELRDRYGTKVAAYCLMNNHVHLLIKAESLESLSKMMRSVGVSYAAYYNLKYLHEGHVFQDRFQSRPICDERYLWGCLRYIHNNPVAAGICAREDYEWSSYKEYEAGKGFADIEEILSDFGSLKDFAQFSEGEYPDDDLDDYLGCTPSDDKMHRAQLIINEELGYEFNNGFVVKKCAKEERDRVLRRLRKEGYSLKQIELLTGVSKRIIQRS